MSLGCNTLRGKSTIALFHIHYMAKYMWTPDLCPPPFSAITIYPSLQLSQPPIFWDIFSIDFGPWLQRFVPIHPQEPKSSGTDVGQEGLLQSWCLVGLRCSPSSSRLILVNHILNGHQNMDGCSIVRIPTHNLQMPRPTHFSCAAQEHNFLNQDKSWRYWKSSTEKIYSTFRHEDTPLQDVKCLGLIFTVISALNILSHA